MRYEFVKMEGCGNDYIYMGAFNQKIDDPSALSIKVSDEHFGIGSDGLILVAPSDVADGRMIMFNLDGSEGKMCGNGIRCVGKFLHDRLGVDKDIITIETQSGIKTLKMFCDEGSAYAARVDMGKAILKPSLIPVNIDGDVVIDRPLNIDDNEYNVTCVSMGNPHAVVFVDDVEDLDLSSIGPKFEHDPVFPESVNTEFVKVIDPTHLRMRVWERGSGETWACGTGTCATVVAACLNGYCNKGEDVEVQLNGGKLVINYTDDTVFMTGPCHDICSGVIEI